MAAPYTPTSTSTSSDPESRLFAQSTFDLLLIELVPMAQRLAEQIYKEDQVAALEGLSLEERRRVGREEEAGGGDGKGGGRKQGGKEGGKEAGGGGSGMKEGEVREAVYYRLERLGYRVGVGLVERYVYTPISLPLFAFPPPPQRSLARPTPHVPFLIPQSPALTTIIPLTLPLHTV